MPIKTNTAMSGFIASAPRLTFSEQGTPRMWARVGQQRWARNPDGSFTQLESAYHDLIMFGRAAQNAAQNLAKGDRFIAEGTVQECEHTNPDGTTEKREQFLAKRIGHDTGYQTTITRTPSPLRAQQAPTPTQEQARQAAETGLGHRDSFPPRPNPGQAPTAIGM
ncbi:MAG: single-stranded DNA-binding protein [Bifidobacteriaceae bacterium]|jgi:single-stranded DNA-binding protein|nr:single-stranded DNA-binding protein [Bifidobacteriaceae bacterium]